MIEMTAPYWIARSDLPGLDFNRQFVAPGSRPEFPDGALAIYVDSDFWCVATLPLEEWIDVPLPELVASLWPAYAKEATYAPDHGTHEQTVHFLQAEVEANRERARHSEEEVARMRLEMDRLRAGRTDVAPRVRTRLEQVNGYFISQYEHLLVATAHEAVPVEDKPGVCGTCGLYVSDRVHQQKWIARKAAGHAPGMPWHSSLPNER